MSTDAGLASGTTEWTVDVRSEISAIGGKINVFAVDMMGKPDELEALDKHLRTGFLKEGTYEEYAEGIKEKMLQELAV